MTRDDGDADQLTDGVYVDAKPIWLSRKCVGWNTKDGKTVSVTLDLGEDKSIEGFSWNTAFGNGGVKFPKSIEVYVSVDGENWGHVGDLLAKATLERVMPPPGSYHVYRAWSRKMPCHGRYVKFLSLQMTHCFCDEIEVYRGDDSLLSMKPPSATTKDPLRDNRAFMFRNRLMKDAERAGAPEETVAKIGEASKDAADDGFRTVVPFNAVHEEILAANAKRLAAAGFGRPAFWTNCRWDNLDPLAVPDAEATRISVDMIRGEVRSATVNIVNPATVPLDCSLSVEGFGADTPVEPMEVLFTDTKHFRCVSGALRSGDGAKLSFRVPAGISKQVWLKVNRPKGAAGVRKGRVVARLSDGTSLAVPLEVRVRDFDMPRDPVLRTGGWDYLDSGATRYGAPGNVQSSLRLHKELETMPCATSEAAPRGAEFDKDGRLVSKLDFASFDKWVAMRPGCADYMIFMAIKDRFCGEPAGTPRFDRMVQEYYRAWAAHMHEIGIGGSRLVLHLLDEPYRVDQAEAFMKWGRPLRALGLKELRVYENPMCDPKTLPREFFDLVDIVCPLDIWCLPEKYRKFYEDLAASGKEVWVYSTRGPARTLCPIGYYRLRGWVAFSIGSPISASLFWAYGSGGGGPAQCWAAYSQTGVDYSPYFVGTREVMDAKQAEAVRESAEDFEYLRLLAAATSRAHAHDVCMRAMAKAYGKKDDADWDSPRDREVLDAARIAILDELDGLAAATEDGHGKFVMRPICKQGYHGKDMPDVPGNSLAAFKLAWEKGARLIETDCHMIKGGRIILVHDQKVLEGRSCERQPPIKTLTEEDVARIDIGKRSKSKKPVRMPYLEEMFATMPKDAVAQCELCGYSETFADTFDALRVKAGLSETNIVVSGAGHNNLADFHRRYPKYRTLWLTSRFLKEKDRSAAIDRVIAVAKEKGLDIVCPRALTAKEVGFSLADAERFRAAGLEFRVWGVNDAELFAYAKSLKVAVFTCANWSEAFEWAKAHPDVEIRP